MPSIDQGWTEWTNGFLQPFCYINGLQIPLGAQSYTKTGQEGSMWALKTHAGTHIVQKHYLSEDAPSLRLGFTFSGKLTVFGQTMADYMRASFAKGAVFYYAPLDRATDIFDSTTGTTAFKLTRPLATSILSGSGVVDGTHPTQVYLNGASSPGSASVSGQTVTASASGIIMIHYTPIYKVICLEWSEAIEQNNGYDLEYTFEEVVTV